MQTCGPARAAARRCAATADSLARSSRLRLSAAELLELRIGIAHRRQITRARPRIQLAKEQVIARLSFQLGHAAVRVIGVAENDGFGRARRFAGRDDFGVADVAVLLFGFDAHVVDALDTVGALLHYAAAAHGDFGIAQQLERGRLPVLEAQEIEAAHFVGTVVRAIACPDAAVIDHFVQAFGAVHGRADGTHLLAGRVLALHARHGLKVRLGIFDATFVVAVDAD